jgi:hypothetical protein
MLRLGKGFIGCALLFAATAVGCATELGGEPDDVAVQQGAVTAADGGVTRAANEDLSQQKALELQMAMQRENQSYTTLSNIMKTKHDTVKNSISNVR